MDRQSGNHHAPELQRVFKEMSSHMSHISYPNLNGQEMTYYLTTVMPRNYTDRQENIIAYISSYMCIHHLVPRGQCAQVHGSKSMCVLRRAPKAYITSISSYLIYITISHLYHHISFVSSVSQYLYLCNHHIACIRPQKVRAPKHTAQNLYVCSNGPQSPIL